ncbi:MULTISPECIES: copper resistance D family protein [Oceanobacillus]|uniref:copper resistance D family protein n=1 Tax=Oceanobacillus TaxID=182709 RepID=UPI0030F517B1
MDIVVMVSQVLLYVCFSVLLGSFLLLLVPSNNRPEVIIRKRMLFISAITLPIFAFIPVLDIIVLIAPRLGLFESIKIVLTTYSVGNAWNFTLFGSAILVFLIVVARSNEKRIFAFLGMILTVGLILTIAWSSHAGSINPTTGIISHFVHLTAVSLWVGILFVVGWCAINYNNWIEFLSWFSQVAFGCLVATGLSGLLLTDVLVEGYTDAWMVSYGQGLLIKHLFLLPLVFYAFINGFIVKYKLSNDATFNPIPWVRVESLILFVIFMITAVFSQQSPPHGNYLTSDVVSPIFRLFQNGIIDSSSTIGLDINLNTVLLLILSILFTGLMVLSFYKKASLIVSFLFSCLFVMSIYSMLMTAVVVR